MNIRLPGSPITMKLIVLLVLFLLIVLTPPIFLVIKHQNVATTSHNALTLAISSTARTKIIIEDLLNMDEHFNNSSSDPTELAKKEFHHARNEIYKQLTEIKELVRIKNFSPPSSYYDFVEEYNAFFAANEKEQEALKWVDQTTLQGWLTLLIQFRNFNDSTVETSLNEIHSQSALSKQLTIIYLLTILALSLLVSWCIWYLLLRPLRQLTSGLSPLMLDHFIEPSTSKRGDEFHELTITMNEMNNELTEQESLRADFIATLSHELRTPLSSIQESVNMMAEELLGKVNDRQRKFLAIASSELKRITALLNHLMDVSTLEEKNKHLDDQVAPEVLIEDCLTRLDTSIKKKGITLNRSFASNLPLIQGNSLELQQIFLNVLGNAIKFSSDHSQIGIHVGTEKNATSVKFHIEDQGIGIESNEKSIIFSKYYRSKKVRKHMDGVGLGLYITRQLVIKLGGSIQATNNPEKGCTFTIHLPVASNP